VQHKELLEHCKGGMHKHAQINQSFSHTLQLLFLPHSGLPQPCAQQSFGKSN